MKVGILGHGFMDWGGGLDFLRLVAGSLAIADPSIELHFLLPTAGPRLYLGKYKRRLRQTFSKLAGQSQAAAKTPNHAHVFDLVRSIEGNTTIHAIDSGEWALRRAVKKHKLDVLLPSVQPLKNPGAPWIGYLYDYQHAYFPHLFSSDELARRDAHFRLMLERASHVVVNAQSVVHDVQRFHPEHGAHIVAMPFSAAPNRSWFELAALDPHSYGIGAPYFIICNQFWQHKDHATAWQAFAQVALQYPDVELVCTGETQDSRNPGYFPELMESAQRLGIAGRLRVLGLIPKVDQIRLLRGAIAVLQPSLFEGGPGGGAVFDAVSLGVRAIVSDIPVNLELPPGDIMFFKAGQSSSLAEAMAQLLTPQGNPQQRRDVSAQALIADGHARRVQCGNVLVHTMAAAIEAWTG